MAELGSHSAGAPWPDRADANTMCELAERRWTAAGWFHPLSRGLVLRALSTKPVNPDARFAMGASNLADIERESAFERAFDHAPRETT